MKLLLVHRYIRPDTPGYAHMLYLMGRRFAEQGHDVTIFSAQPAYNDAYDGPPLPRRQNVDGMTVIRTPLLRERKSSSVLRSLNFLIFSISLFAHSVFRWKAYELITVTTFPPAIMAWVARWIGVFRSTRYVYHCMDLYPEVATVSGILTRNWLARIALWIDKRNCQKAAAVVVLSDDMLATVKKRGISTSNVHVINNFIIDTVDPQQAVPHSLIKQCDRFRVLFAGNIGRFQSLDTVVAAARQLNDLDQIEFWFVGSGVMVESLKAQAGEMLDRTVFFHPYVPIDTVMSVISQADLGVVSLAPGVISCAYPSKTMSYLEAGCRLLVIVEPSSGLSRLIEERDLGVVCSEPDPEIVAAAIRSQYDLWKKGEYNRAAIQEVGRSQFSQQVILARWIDLLPQLADK